MIATDNPEGQNRSAQLAAALVSSLFSGLAHQEARLAVFVSFSDESQGGKFFHHAGIVAHKDYWSEAFAPNWQKYVLDGPPAIPHFHMTEIRSREFREQWGLSEAEAERRTNAAVNILTQSKHIFQIASVMNVTHLAQVGALQVRKNEKSKRKNVVPDHLCFLGFVYTVLDNIADKFPHVRKVDFVVERKKEIFEQVANLYDHFAESLKLMGRTELVELMGGLIPGGKDRLPLQGADVLCWYSQRGVVSELTGDDALRYKALMWRPGERHVWTGDNVIELAKAWQPK